MEWKWAEMEMVRIEKKWKETEMDMERNGNETKWKRNGKK